MYGKIARLAFKTGECWASNSFLDGTKTGRNSSRFISELKTAGYIVIENEGSKFRKIRICPIESRLKNSTSPNVAGSQVDNLANSGGVNNISTSPNVAGLNSQHRQIRRGNLANSGDVHLANSGDRTLQDSTNLNLTAAAPPPPESNTDPPSDEKQAAAAALTIQEIKETLSGLDHTLVFTNNFYPKAFTFMAKHGLTRTYLSWMIDRCILQKPRSLRSLYYSLFFADDLVELFKQQQQPAAPPPDMPCPVCGTLHAQRDDICPSCGLPKNAPADRIRLLRQLHEFPPEKRDEYFRREQDIDKVCDLKDFKKYSSLLTSLQKEFGLETA